MNKLHILLLAVQLWKKRLPNGKNISSFGTRFILQLQLLHKVSIHIFQSKFILGAFQKSLTEQKVSNMNRLKIEIFFEFEMLPFATVSICTPSSHESLLRKTVTLEQITCSCCTPSEKINTHTNIQLLRNTFRCYGIEYV